MKKVANNKLLIFWVIFACIIGILGACQATLLNNDDVAYMQNFINEKMKFSGGGGENSLFKGDFIYWYECRCFS